MLTNYNYPMKTIEKEKSKFFSKKTEMTPESSLTASLPLFYIKQMNIIHDKEKCTNLIEKLRVNIYYIIPKVKYTDLEQRQGAKVRCSSLPVKVMGTRHTTWVENGVDCCKDTYFYEWTVSHGRLQNDDVIGCVPNDAQGCCSLRGVAKLQCGYFFGFLGRGECFKNFSFACHDLIHHDIIIC